jgi:hypothetical protein
MDAQYILNSALKAQSTNTHQQTPSGHVPSTARETANLWAEFQALQAAMGSFKENKKI